MDEQRLANFFKESEKKPFVELPTVLIVGIATLVKGTNLKIKNIFDNVPIYEIPGYTRGKNKKVKIPHPGIPYAVMSAKHGRKIRGIVKKLDDLKKREDGKGKFPNCVILDISLPDKVINVMLFSDSLKITGANKPDHLVQTFVFIKALLNMMHGKGIVVWEKSLILVKLNIVMENIVFDLGFKVRKKALIKKAEEEEGIASPPEGEAVRILYPTGEQKAKGGEKFFNFRVLHTGKVVFSGPCRKRMAPIYDEFMGFISRNEAAIRFN